MRLSSFPLPLIPLLLALAILPPPLASGEETSDGKVPASLQQWLAQLNSAQFVEREQATQHLLQAGAASIEPLMEHLPTASPEATARGMHVLVELALSRELQTSEQAWKAIERLAESQQGPLQRRAADSLATLHSLRQQRARELLVRAGARVTDRHGQIGGAIITMVYAVEIPPEFTGDLETMQQLRWLEETRMVTLRGERVNDKWLEPLVKLKELAVLEIKHSKVTDAGLKQLQQLPNLQHLSLYYSPVSDGAIETLGSMKTLAEVRLFGTDISQEGAANLGKALAHTTIDFRQGAFLGVGCQAHPEGAQITILHDDSAADRAGLRAGDVIQRFHGTPVADFDELRAAIAKHPAGEVVTMKVRREVQPMEFQQLDIEVKLGEWE